MIVVVDYDVGNIGSILRMLKKVGVEAVLSRDPVEIREAEKILLPGVGAFESGMRKLEASGLRPALDDAAMIRKRPVLGICLGMQMLFEASEEGAVPGLGWIPGTIRRFEFENGSSQKVPHMGWNHVHPTAKSALFSGLDGSSRFYFVHSYFAEPRDSADSIATCIYGSRFCCAVGRENVFGVQFHPEKSHRFGLQLLGNFANI